LYGIQDNWGHRQLPAGRQQRRRLGHLACQPQPEVRESSGTDPRVLCRPLEGGDLPDHRVDDAHDGRRLHQPGPLRHGLARTTDQVVGDRELWLTRPTGPRWRRRGRIDGGRGGPDLMTETLMPGGGVARRPLHFIVMADCSGSMKGEKMQALNYAL